MLELSLLFFSSEIHVIQCRTKSLFIKFQVPVHDILLKIVKIDAAIYNIIAPDSSLLSVSAMDFIVLCPAPL